MSFAANTIRRGSRRFGLPLASGGAITPSPIMVQAKAAATTAVTLTSFVTVGNMLIVAVGWETANVNAIVADNRGTVFTACSAHVVGAVTFAQLFVGIAGSSGACTITTTVAGGTFIDIAAAEFSSVVGASAETGSAFNAASPPTCSLTSQGLIFSAVKGFHNGTTFTATAPFTLLAQANGSDAIGIAWSWQPTSGNYTSLYGGIAIDNWLVVMVGIH